jgi:hypothetical protein
MDAATLISVIGIGALILLFLWYRAYVKEKESSLRFRQEKIVETDLFGRKLEMLSLDMYSTKSTFKILFVALVMIIVLTLCAFLLIHFSLID